MRFCEKKTARDESFEPQFEYREFLPNYERLVLEKPEIAVSDLFEEATSFLASHNKEMESLTDDLKRTSFKMNKQTKSLVNANSQGHDKQVARLIQEILDTLIDYRNKLKMRLPIMSSSMEKALVLSQRAINLIKLNDLHAQFDLNFLVGPMSGMKSALSDLKPTVEAASLSFNDWPEIGGDFDGNKDRVLALHKDFCGFVDRSVALMTDIEEEIVNGS